MEITAAVNTISPQTSPSDKAIPPIDACTVAFGKYRNENKKFFFYRKLS